MLGLIHVLTKLNIEKKSNKINLILFLGQMMLEKDFRGLPDGKLGS